MDCAYNNSKLGVQIKVRATDISGYHMGHYSCIFCGEPVTFYRGEIQRPHFRHKHGSIIAQTCEFYAKNISELSENELRRKISGIPFYLKPIGDNFKLYLGLWPIDESILTEEKIIGQKIIIKNEKMLPIEVINLENVRANETYPIYISLIYDSYEFSYKIPGTALSEIWGKKTSRIFSKGLFFRIGNIYSRSISLNGVVTVDSSYYFLSRDSVTNNSFFEVEDSYPLLTNGIQEWKIYKIRFTKITQESTRFAGDHYVQLLEKPPELIPLWPPSIQSGQKYLHQKTGLSTFRLNSSHAYGKWEIIILNKCGELSGKREIFFQDPVFSIEVDNNMQYLSFFDTDNDFEAALVTRYDKTVIQYQQPILELKWMKKHIIPGSERRAIKNADLSIKSNIKCDIIRMRNHIPNLIFRNELSVLSFPDLSNGDTIIIRHGLEILAPLYFRKTRKTLDDENSNNLSDEELYQKLSQRKGTFVIVPAQLKYIASEFGSYPKTGEYLKKSLKIGRISKRTVDYLLKKHWKGEF